jgi:hypothetical protein
MFHICPEIPDLEGARQLMIHQYLIIPALKLHSHRQTFYKGKHYV